MIIEDLRNIFAHCRDELIEVSQEFIYYAEEKVEEGRDCLFLLEYNRKTKRERILSNYILQNPSFVYHYYGFPNDIVVVMENGDSEDWVLRADGTKVSGIRNMALLTDDAEGAEVYGAKLALLRERRNRLLNESDWTQMIDNDLSDEAIWRWREYRQALRDLPQTVSPDNIDEADWPIPPD